MPFNPEIAINTFYVWEYIIAQYAGISYFLVSFDL